MMVTIWLNLAPTKHLFDCNNKNFNTCEKHSLLGPPLHKNPAVGVKTVINTYSTSLSKHISQFRLIALDNNTKETK